MQKQKDLIDGLGVIGLVKYTIKMGCVRAKLITKPGAGHEWPGLFYDLRVIADWFDDYWGQDNSMVS